MKRKTAERSRLTSHGHVRSASVSAACAAEARPAGVYARVPLSGASCEPFGERGVRKTSERFPRTVKFCGNRSRMAREQNKHSPDSARAQGRDAIGSEKRAAGSMLGGRNRGPVYRDTRNYTSLLPSPSTPPPLPSPLRTARIPS
ncbi:unnamed protein product, partial [Iphiclides podalirius]